MIADNLPRYPPARLWLTVSALTPKQISAIDAAYIWHPTARSGDTALAPVVAVAAKGAWLTVVRDGRSPCTRRHERPGGRQSMGTATPCSMRL